MATDTIVTTGVVRGNTIVLDNGPSLRDGTRVTVTVTKEEKSPEERRRELYERLEAEGVITVPKTPPEQIREYKPIKVKGKPLSQIIIEERR
ncbi:MAG: hypothetical protein FJ279_28390 [Planctomycetes bacterium]|nr:hypothetical protein [Planctomycetota bacterium]